MRFKKSLFAAAVGLFGSVGSQQLVFAEEVQASNAIEEIIVTATKRVTSLQDTAIAISALSNSTIEKRGLVGMEDYLSTLPGITMQDRGAGQNTITIRGVGSGSQVERNPTVGVYLGETPVTGLGANGNGNQGGSADIKLVDIERIEVLRGPQGTLYGTGSMGGTVRAIPIAPNLEEMEGKIATRYSETSNRGGSNSMVQGVINFPVIKDELAFRTVAYKFDNSGYIDNVSESQISPVNASSIAAGGLARNRNDVGNDEYTGARIIALWQAVDQLEVSLMHAYQKIEQDGLREVDINLIGDFQQASLSISGNGDGEELNSKTNISNLTLKYDLGWGSILSSTSKIVHDGSSKIDASTFFGPTFGVSINEVDTDVFTQELRFVSQFDGPLQVLGGYYYEDNETNTNSLFQWSGILPAPVGANPNLTFLTARTVEVTQEAFFGELSYDITNQLNATAGFRYFDYDQGIPFNRTNGITSAVQGVKGNINDTNFKFNLAYHISENTLIYGQWAEGFRIGRIQSPSNSSDDIDDDGLIEFSDGVERAITEGILEPDTVESFEFGLKAKLMDNRLTLNSSVFRINWEGIPITLVSEARGSGFLFNAGESSSEGVELEIQAQLTNALILELSSSYVETVLEEDAPSLGNMGDNLPGSADFNFSASLEHQFNLRGYESFARIDYSYIGEYFHNFSETGEVSGGYNQINLKVGTQIDRLNIDIFANNLTDADNFTWVENLANAGRAYRLRPRTIGLNIGYLF